MMNKASYWLVALTLMGCGGDDAPAADSTRDAAPSPPGPPSGTTPIEAEPQRSGDPDEGYRVLVNDPYVSCGVPRGTYELAFGAPLPEDQIPGRTGESVGLPYNRTGLVTESGVRLV